jgi:hypothetical protein
MGQIDAPAWWADVQHLRDVHERTEEARRLADLADRRAGRDRRTGDVAERRHEVRDRQGDVEIVRPLPPRRGPHVKGSAVPTRRTIEIRGRTVPAPAVPRTSVELDRRRPQRRAVERVGARPDRVAMWALLMGLVLILVAVGTADASVLAH